VWGGYLVRQQLTGRKNIHWIEENHEVSKRKTKLKFESLYAVRQKAENFVEGNCWDGMWN
jgi:hypothetical protein